MQLIADRFIEEDDGRVFDAATLERVRLVVSHSRAAAEQTRWAVRCDTLHAIEHRAIARLLDFGGIGTDLQFEAWQCARSWTGSHDEGARAHEAARRFLRSVGLTTGEADDLACAAAPVVVPGVATGYPSTPEPHLLAPSPLEDYAVGLIPQPAVCAIAETLKDATGPRPHVIALHGPRGSGRRTAVRELARIARTTGFVPVDARLIGTRYSDLWTGRSLFVVAAGEQSCAWSALLRAVSASSRPHVMLIVAEEEIDGVDGVAVCRVAPDVLAGAILPQPAGAAAQRVRRAAADAHGLPGRFVTAIWRIRDPESPARRRPGRGARAAEASGVYSTNPAIGDATSPSAPRSDWPAPGELAALRRRMDAACRLLNGGRHAPGVRQLRHAVGGLARRDAWIDAGEGALALAAALLKRGRVREAQTALDEARTYAGRAEQEPMLVDVAVLGGECWIDRGRLDDAETVLAASAAAARASGDPVRRARASLALARCLFWRARYDEADAALPSDHDDVPVPLRVRRGSLAAHIAVGYRDLPRAVAHAAAALHLATTTAIPDLRAIASEASAFVHLATADDDAVDRDVAAAICAARAAHDPLCAIGARLLLAEAERRRGRAAAAVACARRLGSRDGSVPPIVSARAALLRDLIADAGNSDAVLRRHIAATGLPALALFVPPARAAHGLPIADPLLDEIVAILCACQAADDEHVVLRGVCGRMRRQLRASAVACIAVVGDRREIVANDGIRFEPAVLARVLSAGIAIAPHRCDDRIEAAAPVQYGGIVIGAVCARWSLGSTDDLSRAASILSMAAAAIAPVVSAMAARRERRPTGVPDFLGVTPAIGDLREAIERAAAAPFPVLIEGESGCGKELVARAIHRCSSRRDRTFGTVNCAALPDDLLEAELFGHARGAFTGAIADRPGVFEEAHGGTLLLDEVGELSPRAQAKLLRVLQEGELRRVGENVSRRIDVRIVAATNRDLRQEVEERRFRLDLLYRLDVVRIVVPPLRDRREDIPVLVDHFWRDATARTGSRATLAAATRAALVRYNWPGNVRELQNVLAALAVRSPKRGAVPPTALPRQFGDTRKADGWRIDDARRTFEEGFVRAALVRAGGHRGRAAEELGVTRQGLTKLMMRLGIQ